MRRKKALQTSTQNHALLQSESKEGTPRPPAVAGVVPDIRRLRSSALNDREDVGNIGLIFGKWGRRTKQKANEVQQNIDAQIKKPCQIIGLPECEQETQDLLI